jgi:hypothetical protein
MLDFLVTILFFIVGLVLGFYLLLFGRQKMVITTAIICLAATGSLLAFIFLRENNGWALTEVPDWPLLGITVAAGIIGGILGARVKHAAAAIVGFFAGGYIGIWFYNIAFHFVVNMGHWPEETAFWVGVVILIISGLIGLFLTRRSEAVALILISVFVGTDLIVRVFGLSPEKNITAVISISLALLGLIVQYAQFLREIKGDNLSLFAAQTGPAPAPEFFDLSDDHG